MTANGDCRPNGKCGFNQIIHRYSVCQALRCFQYLYCPVVTHSLCCWAFWFPVTGSTITRTKQLVVRLSQVTDFLSFGLYGPNCSASSYRRSTRCNISYSLFCSCIETANQSHVLLRLISHSLIRSYKVKKSKSVILKVFALGKSAR